LLRRLIIETARWIESAARFCFGEVSGAALNSVSAHSSRHQINLGAPEV